MREMGSAVLRSHWPANLPRPTITVGRIISIFLSRNGWHAMISSGSGLRFSGGRHIKTFAMNTSLRGIFSPFSMMSVSSCPARPTKARPWASSSPPGASPTNMRRALGLPWPKTMLRRPPASLQRWQSPTHSRTAFSSAPASESAAGGAAGSAHVVGDHQVDALLGPLLAGALEQALRLGREADEEALLFRLSQRLQDVGRPHQVQLLSPVLLLDLARRLFRGPVVRHRRRHG